LNDKPYIILWTIGVMDLETSQLEMSTIALASKLWSPTICGWRSYPLGQVSCSKNKIVYVVITGKKILNMGQFAT
jgi:hypothetical protein